MLVVLTAGGCSSDDEQTSGGDSDNTVVADPAVVADSTLTDPAEYATNGDDVEEEPGFVKVDANTATIAELVATFETNQIVGASTDGTTWARAVVDQRPYARDGLSGAAFDSLRLALAGAGLDDFTAEAVVASLAV